MNKFEFDLLTLSVRVNLIGRILMHRANPNAIKRRDTDLFV